jgi:hypothetical protein
MTEEQALQVIDLLSNINDMSMWQVVGAYITIGIMIGLSLVLILAVILNDV